MPDLLAGTKVTALDTPETVEDYQADLFSLNSGGTTYGTSSTSGTYNDCGVAFVAPTTGRVLIHHAAGVRNSTASEWGMISPQVREGSTVGSGTIVLTADDRYAVRGEADNQIGRTILASGLTPGDTYNVQLLHKRSGGSADFFRRNVIVEPTS